MTRLARDSLSSSTKGGVIRQRLARARLARWAVHPGRLEIINAAFTPAPEELTRARELLDALTRAEGRGAVELHGEMIDEASRKLALEVIARGRAAGLDEASG